MSERHLLQSDAWAAFRVAWGTPIARACDVQLTLHPVGFGLPWTIAYAPRPRTEDLHWSAMIETARERGWAFVRVEPDGDELRAEEALRLAPAHSLLGRATFVLDLTPHPGSLLAKMRKTTRYNIGLARRKGVRVETGAEPELLEDFLPLNRATALRHGFLARPDRYYRLLFEVFGARGAVHLVNAYYGDECLSAHLVVRDGATLYYLYAGSAGTHPEAMACYAGVWGMIELGQALGCARLDFWSALHPDEADKRHPWYGFHYFKEGFGGRLVTFPGAFDLVIDPLAHHVLGLAEAVRGRVLHATSALARTRPAHWAPPSARARARAPGRAA